MGGVREAPLDPKTATRPGVNEAAWEVIDPDDGGHKALCPPSGTI